MLKLGAARGQDASNSRKRDVTPQKRVVIGLYLAGLSENSRLPRGSKKLAMQTFKTSRGSVDSIWRLRRK
ncbi:hypothetical protein F441_14826 [Phytophthora nicotianae CJ01A1]|uniref:Uncharacterized protein n=4 Tax=Phytophthora nicotianae TaxID=4792 RepID=W2Q893_PHYN3|nr:hypothetical protein PPTG_22923 [Phytophthora nicotianae INRA-310]ETM46625.1 hypothetical protein L914_08518 [Phytophthora nicotianae]ETN09091.1 hypothetical protein PPTG_22923 [Phytophthora nicotianae INRA-310]ETO75576.1 hypothetical protein F444_08863 [Phytophthora nicotianae P1976]ETP09304.1 hypothetical protein F441_14826 [Phytophthora nicotianae CJ01A1]